MSKQTIKNQYGLSPSGQLVIVLSNTKYTYAHFTEFHETVLNILDNNDLSHLSSVQTKNTVLFINMVLGLLDSPTKNAIVKNRNSEYQILTDRRTDLESNKVLIPGPDVKTSPRPTSEEELLKLLGWIDQIVVLQRITVEKMLDEFYSLGIVDLKL